MRSNLPARTPQITLRNNSAPLRIHESEAESIRWWIENYFAIEVTTSDSSQKVQRRDLGLFADFFERECGAVSAWSPRLSRAFQKDRSRYRGERPKRKSYRPYRNRAIVYTLIGTGMRRAAVCNLNLADVDFRRRSIAVVEKGGHTHHYQISAEGLAAIRDYIEEERSQDEGASPALFLSAAVNANGKGRLSAVAINEIWNEVAKRAGVDGRTPHSARHAMGRHIVEKTGNVAAVQRQLGHKNAAYSMQYSRITREEINEVLDEQ